MSHIIRQRTRNGEPTMLHPDAPPADPGRPFVDDLDECDRRFGVVTPTPARPHPIRPRPVDARIVPPLKAPDRTLPLPKQRFVPWRVGYAAALPPLQFKIGLAGYAENPALKIRAAFDAVMEAVEAAFRIGRHEIVSERRTNAVAIPRLAFYLLMIEFTEWSCPRIARSVNRHDHSTVIHGVNRARYLESVDPDFAARLGQARRIVEARYVPGATHVRGAR